MAPIATCAVERVHCSIDAHSAPRMDQVSIVFGKLDGVSLANRQNSERLRDSDKYG